MPDFGAYFRKVFAEWSGQRERIIQLETDMAVQAKTIARLKTELSDTESHTRYQTRYTEKLSATIAALEEKYVLPGPLDRAWLTEIEILNRLPLPLTTRENSKAAVLPLADWERFAVWAIPRVRNTRPYELDLFDCGGMTRMLLGLAEEWAPGLACGWVNLTSPVQKVAHRMVWLLARSPDGTAALRYIDATPRGIVPWSEGIFAETKSADGTPWRLDRLGF